MLPLSDLLNGGFCVAEDDDVTHKRTFVQKHYIPWRSASSHMVSYYTYDSRQ